MSITSLTPTGTPFSTPGPPGMVDGARLRQGELGVEPDPGLDRGARRGAVEAVAHQGLGGQAAGFEAGGRFARGQAFGAAHRAFSGQPVFDPEARLQQPRILVAAADQLDADRQPIRPMSGRQGQAGHGRIASTTR